MGGCMSSQSDGPAEQRSKEIEKLIKEDEKRLAKEIKLLLLGAGASGKSTVLKQMRYIHNKPFTPGEVEDYRKIVFSNIVGGMRSIIDTMDDLGLAVASSNRKYISMVDNEVPVNTGESFPLPYLEALSNLWKDENVQKCYKEGYRFALQENLTYFYADLPRLFLPGYKPSHDDMLRVRSKTTGISETRFELDTLTIRMFDVGGQRSERRKWTSVFEGVTAILFLVSLSDYNSCLIEDKDSNGLLEALILFDSIVNSQWFVKTSVILFLNKADLLMEKIRDPAQQIAPIYPDFKGKPGSFNDAVAFFKEKFRSLNRTPSKEIYTHVTTATDTEALKVVMAAAQDTIVRTQLREMSIL